jgi:hypothetical protein
MAPPPAPDTTGLRGKPGITGELKAHLLELTQRDEELKEFMHDFDTPTGWDDVWNAVLMRYRLLHASTHVFHTLRVAFDGANQAEGKDWFPPYVAAMCAWQEHEYRRCLGMPPALGSSGNSADIEALKMSAFMNCVMSGARYPDLDWRKLDGTTERGDVDAS